MAQDKPAGISLNLDSLEREGAPQPFVVVHEGRRVAFLDAQEIDFRDLLALTSDPARFFDVALDEQDRRHFAEHKMPAWKLNRLVSAYLEHHQVDPGNPAASPAS